MSHRILKHAALRGACAAAALALAAFAAPATAQTKAALVRDLDEPGRSPYSEDVVGTCGVATCQFEFAAVPAGKRLVIERINGVARSFSNATVYSIAQLVTNSSVSATAGVRNTFRMAFLEAAGASNFYNGYYVDASTKAYVSPGGNPRVSINTSTAGATAFAQVTLSGYFVDITP